MFKIDYSYAFVDELELKKVAPFVILALERLLDERPGFLELVFHNVERLLAIKRELEQFCDRMLLIGIGGSSLGAETLISALGKPERLVVLDNVDPEKLDSILSKIEPQKTCVNVVSKSGSTAETIANFLLVVDFMKKSLTWNEIKRRLVLTTDPERGDLRRLAKEEEIRALEVPPPVAGRYSVLSDVGLFPAAFCGVDVERVLAGARVIYESLSKKDYTNPALLLTAVYWLNYLKFKTIFVMMPYSERLSRFSDWFRQLWAESLGKGGKGQTPVKATGTVDQHSQIQLYNDGPRDKIITVLTVSRRERVFRFPLLFSQYNSFFYFAGHTLSELFDAEAYGTMGAFVKYGVPFVHIRLDELTPEVMGALLFLYEVITALFGFMLGVNPFDQPAVEEGKRFAYGLLGREGFEEKKRELEELMKGSERFLKI